MILNHLMGLYTHPKQEWHTIEKNHEALKSSLSHVVLIALIPAICSYIATAYQRILFDSYLFENK